MEDHPGALPESLASVTRHALTLGAGWLVGKGFIPNALVGDLVAVGMVGAAFGWSQLRVARTQKVLKTVRTVKKLVKTATKAK